MADINIRQTASNGNKNAGLNITNQTSGWFPVGIKESATNATNGLFRIIELETVEIWAELNLVGKTAEGKNTYTSKSMSQKHVHNVQLPGQYFASDIAKFEQFEMASNESKLADLIAMSKERGAMLEIFAKNRAKFKIIKDKLAAEAVAKQVAGQYGQIELHHITQAATETTPAGALHVFWNTEIKPMIDELARESSLFTLTQPGRIFEKYSVTESDNNGFKRVNLTRK